MMRYLPARVVMVPATVARAAGCGAEISGKSAPAPASAKVIARHMGTPKGARPGRFPEASSREEVSPG